MEEKKHRKKHYKLLSKNPLDDPLILVWLFYILPVGVGKRNRRAARGCWRSACMSFPLLQRRLTFAPAQWACSPGSGLGNSICFICTEYRLAFTSWTMLPFNIFFCLFLIYFFFLTLGFPGRTLVAEKMPYCIYWWVSLNFKVTQIIQRSGHTIEQKTDTANIIICKSLRKSQVKSEDAVSLKWTWIADSERWY